MNFCLALGGVFIFLSFCCWCVMISLSDAYGFSVLFALFLASFLDIWHLIAVVRAHHKYMNQLIYIFFPAFQLSRTPILLSLKQFLAANGNAQLLIYFHADIRQNIWLFSLLFCLFFELLHHQKCNGTNESKWF